jgi:hypothetical protein
MENNVCAPLFLGPLVIWEGMWPCINPPLGPRPHSSALQVMWVTMWPGSRCLFLVFRPWSLLPVNSNLVQCLARAV